MDLIHRRAGDKRAAALLKRAVTACRLRHARSVGTRWFWPFGPQLGQAKKAAGLQAQRP
jgi:hypothetical protein